MSDADGAHLVAIESATETVGVAVRRADGLAAEFTLTGRRRHVESLTPALEHLLAQVGLEVGDIEVVAVDLGPGLFTGLRVGVSAAKGLAQALGIGIIGASSLDILLAAAAAAGHRGRVLAAVDARRGEVFASLATIDASGTVAGTEAPRLLTPADLAAWLQSIAGEPVLAIGDGSQRYAEVIDAVPGVHCVRWAFCAGRRRRPCSHWPPRASRPAKRQSSRSTSFLSTCATPMPRSTSPRSRETDVVAALQLRIEKLKRRDLRHLMPIEASVFPEPWSVSVFNSELALRHGRLYRAAWDGEQMAGYIGFLIVDDEAHITTIATAPIYQRAGVASALIIDGIGSLLEMGVKHLSLEVAAHNEPAQSLYRRFGFAPIGVRKNYYPVTGEDALVMWAYDIDSEEYGQRLKNLTQERRAG